jgi:hypothetical protein
MFRPVCILSIRKHLEILGDDIKGSWQVINLSQVGKNIIYSERAHHTA